MDTPRHAPLDLPGRRESLERAARAGVDLLVIGGGITGAGVALDAVTRGLRVVLVERGDVASGTSSRSSKLVHGGVRYLAQGDLSMVLEGVGERSVLRRSAPHLVRPLGFVVPLGSGRRRVEMKIGLTLYDGLAFGRNVRRHTRLSTDEVLRLAPGIVRGFDHGGYRYEDCQTDDARLTLQVIQVARRLGALVTTRAEVEELWGADGRVQGASVRDRVAGDVLRIGARWTVNATGVWVGAVRGRAQPAGATTVTPAKGVHLVFLRSRFPIRQAVVLPSAAGDGRRCFLVPWGDQVYAGTTDGAYDGDLDRAALSPGDADYLLAALNRAFGLRLTSSDAIAAWAGLRPLSAGVASASRDLSRRHVVAEDPPGLVTVTGGKLTTFRRMARDVVDRVAPGTTSRTRRIPLGAVGPAEAGLERLRAALDSPLDERALQGLYHRHGDAAVAVHRFCERHDGLDPLVPGLPYLAGEARWAVRHELARSVDDVLQRRLRVAIRDAAAGGAAIHRVASVVAEELGLSPEARDRQVAEYLDAVREERGPVPLDESWRADARS